MKTVPMMFIANLAACDLITTISSIAFDLPELELGYWPYGAVPCRIIYPLATFSTNAAALTLVAISIDRYISIICPLNLRYRITKAGLGSSTCGEDWPDGYSLDKAYTVLLFALQYGLPLVIMSVVYTRIGLKLCKNTGKAAELSSGKTNRSRSSTTSSGQTLLHGALDKATYTLQRRKRQNEKAAKMFLFVVLIFLIFMMPHQLLWLSLQYASNASGFQQYEDLIVFVCGAFTYANSVLNPVVYGVCNGNFRRGVLSVLKCQCSKASQRRQVREAEIRRTETMLSTKLAPVYSTGGSSGFKEKITHSNAVHVSLQREALIRNGNCVANQGALKTNQGQRSVSKIPTKKFMTESETEENNNSHKTKPRGDKIPNGSVAAKAEIRNSLYDNSLNGHLSQQNSENDTMKWLRETEALLKKLCQEFEVSRGDKNTRYGAQREIPFPTKEKNILGAQLCAEKETIL
ncbi:Neuropeptide FF receptor 2 [Stylophora pistillata]|uniref:Neuropeptide FF receptor 2 n=1 Tax=Stylophora pistillata TaxID=50429 RepID=A0A2B4RYC1_STYPI|nr:Neuropeptide FF receptor 2 [Stylophora pistillata]